MSESSEFEEGYRRLQQRYVDRTLERIERLESLVNDGDAGGAKTLQKVVRIVHRLAGSGETMGFAEVSELSIAMEERLGSVEESADGTWRGEVEAYCRDVREALGEPAGGS